MHRRFRNALVIGWLLAWSLSASVSTAQLPFIQLKSISKPILAAGSETELSVGGNRIDEVSILRFSHAGISATVLEDAKRAFSETPQAKYGHFRVRVAADVPAGLYDVRAIGRFGVSNPRTILVHGGPTIDLSPSHEPNAPTQLTLDNLHRTQSTAAAADYYQFHLEKGAQARIHLICQDIDSRMIGAMS